MASGVGVLTSGLRLASATEPSTTILGRGLRRSSHADATTSVFSTPKENLSWRPKSATKRQSRASRHAFSSTAAREHTTCSYSFPSSARGTAYRTAPLQPQSQTGEYLTYVLRSETDLFEKSVEAEVKRIRGELFAIESSEHRACTTGIEREDEILSARMREVKAQELRRHLEDVLYTCVVKRLGDHGLSLTPSVYKHQLNRLSDNAHLEVPLLLEVIEVPTAEARSIVIEHVRKVTESVPNTGDTQTPILLPKYGMAQVYANAAIFGYCLRRVTERFEMEKLLPVTLSDGLQEVLDAVSTQPVTQLVTPFKTQVSEEILIQMCDFGADVLPQRPRPFSDEKASLPHDFHHSRFASEVQARQMAGSSSPAPSPASSPASSPAASPACTLKQYAGLFLEHASARELAKVDRYLSVEASELVQRHTAALFGNFSSEPPRELEQAMLEAHSEEEAQSLLGMAMRSGRVESLEMSLMGVRRLVLEAVATGSALFDAERAIDLQCPLTTRLTTKTTR